MWWFLIIPELFVSHSIVFALGFVTAALFNSSGDDPPMPGSDLN